MSRKKTYRYLRRKLENFRQYVYPNPEPQHANVGVEVDGNCATVYIGEESFFIQSNYAEPLEHEVYDFALYGALAVGLTKNLILHCDLPVSRSCAQSLDDVCQVMRILNHPTICVQSVQLSNVVDDPVGFGGGDGMICMSGGVDSTYGGYLQSKQHEYSHGMLIAGADYPGVESSGFKELSERVSKICNHFDLSLVIVETSIRSLNVNWAMTHSLCLAMALHFHSGYFSKGAVSADYTHLEEIAVGPWGNSFPVIDALSSTRYPIRHLGGNMSRGGKVKRLYEDAPSLLDEVSVCYTDKDIGGNCGECPKCVITMVNLFSVGADYASYFSTNKSLLSLIQSSKPHRDSQATVRLYLSWCIESERHLPDGEIKTALNEYIGRLQAAVYPMG